MKKQRGTACLLAACLCGLLLAGCAPQDASALRGEPPQSESAPDETMAAAAPYDEFTLYLPETWGSPAEGNPTGGIYFIDKASSEFPARIPGTLYHYSAGGFTPLLEDVYFMCGQDEEYLFLVQRDFEAEPIGEWFYGVHYKANVVAYNLENGAVQTLIGDVDTALYLDNHSILFTRISEKEDGRFYATLYTQEGTGIAPTELLSVDIANPFAHCTLSKEGGYVYFEYFFDARCVRLSPEGEVLADSTQVPIGLGNAVYTDETIKWRDFVYDCGGYSIHGRFDSTLGNTTVIQEDGTQSSLDMDTSMPFTSPGNGLFYYFARDAKGTRPMVYDGAQSYEMELGNGSFIYTGYKLFFVEEAFLEGESLYEEGEAGARDRVTLYEVTGTMDNPSIATPIVSFVNPRQTYTQHIITSVIDYQRDFGEYVVFGMTNLVQNVALNTRTGEIAFTDTPGLQVEWYR